MTKHKAHPAHPHPRSAAAGAADAAPELPLDERIRQRAYELFEQRGGAHGGHEEDWLQAEREMLAERSAG